MHFGCQNVAIAPDGLQQLRTAWIGFDFLAQAADLAVDAAVKRLRVAAGSEFQQAFTAEHGIWMGQQYPQQPEFSDAQGKQLDDLTYNTVGDGRRVWVGLNNSF